jgi:hypothetical protein
MVNMVVEGRLQVKINHVTQSVTFEQEHPINVWDNRLEQICKQINKASDMIVSKNHEWYEKNFAFTQ